MPTNKQRSDSISFQVSAYRDASDKPDAPLPQVVCDMLTDLMHFCDEQCVSFEDALAIAEIHHDAEVLNPEQEPPHEPTKSEIVIQAAKAMGYTIIDMPMVESLPEAFKGIPVPKAWAVSSAKYGHDKPVIDVPTDKPPVWECANCGRFYLEESEMESVKDIWERVQPGETMPAGECPNCHALCYPIKPPLRMWTVLYSSDAGDQVEIVYCDHEPTIEDVIGKFEHLQQRKADGFLDTDDFIIHEYSNPPTIK
jgi:hypothetical protein